MTDQEARKHPRTPLEVTVDWQLLGSEDVIWSATDDVGPGGLRVRTLTPPPEGAQVVVVLSPAEDSDGLLRVPARVVWTRLEDDFCGMGLEFEPESDAERAGLEAVLNQLTEKFAEP